MTFVGTSLTATSNWPDNLLKRLAECLPYPPEISRVARPAATSRWGLSQVKQIAETRADIVIIEFAINDADVRIGQTLRASLATHEAMIDALEIALPEASIYLMTTNPALGRAAGRRPALQAYYQSYETLAERRDLGLVDAYRRWLLLGDLGEVIADGLHPRNEVATQVIVPALVPIIAETLGHPRAACEQN